MELDIDLFLSLQVSFQLELCLLTECQCNQIYNVVGRASVTRQYSFGTGEGAVMPCGWEGNHRSGHVSPTSVVYPPVGSQPRKGR